MRPIRWVPGHLPHTPISYNYLAWLTRLRSLWGFSSHIQQPHPNPGTSTNSLECPSQWSNHRQLLLMLSSLLNRHLLREALPDHSLSRADSNILNFCSCLFLSYNPSQITVIFPIHLFSSICPCRMEVPWWQICELLFTVVFQALSKLLFSA